MLAKILKVLGGNAFLVASITGMLATVWLWDSSRLKAAKKLGRHELSSEILKQDNELNGKADKARRAANRPGAFERLRKNYCPTC